MFDPQHAGGESPRQLAPGYGRRRGPRVLRTLGHPGDRGRAGDTEEAIGVAEEAPSPLTLVTRGVRQGAGHFIAVPLQSVPLHKH